MTWLNSNVNNMNINQTCIALHIMLYKTLFCIITTDTHVVWSEHPFLHRSQWMQVYKHLAWEHSYNTRVSDGAHQCSAHVHILLHCGTVRHCPASWPGVCCIIRLVANVTPQCDIRLSKHLLLPIASRFIIYCIHQENIMDTAQRNF